MKNKQLKPKEKLKADVHETPILVRDVARYLSGLAKLHDSETIGNSQLSEGLRQVADALRPYGKLPVSELGNAIKVKPASANVTKGASSRIKLALPPDLESLAHEDVEKILDNDDYTKQQIADLGFKRFGISKPMIQRLRKEEAKQSVRSALDNERTLDVISKMARKAGKSRAS